MTPSPDPQRSDKPIEREITLENGQRVQVTFSTGENVPPPCGNDKAVLAWITAQAQQQAQKH